MDLISAEPFQLAGVQRLTECLLADQGPVRQFLFPGLEPWQYLAFEEAAQALGVSMAGASSSSSFVSW
jgi:hypothetical protein